MHLPLFEVESRTDTVHITTSQLQGFLARYAIGGGGNAYFLERANVTALRQAAGAAGEFPTAAPAGVLRFRAEVLLDQETDDDGKGRAAPEPQTAESKVGASIFRLVQQAASRRVSSTGGAGMAAAARAQVDQPSASDTSMSALAPPKQHQQQRPDSNAEARAAAAALPDPRARAFVAALRWLRWEASEEAGDPETDMRLLVDEGALPAHCRTFLACWCGRAQHELSADATRARLAAEAATAQSIDSLCVLFGLADPEQSGQSVHHILRGALQFFPALLGKQLQLWRQLAGRPWWLDGQPMTDTDAELVRVDTADVSATPLPWVRASCRLARHHLPDARSLAAGGPGSAAGAAHGGGRSDRPATGGRARLPRLRRRRRRAGSHPGGSMTRVLDHDVTSSARVRGRVPLSRRTAAAERVAAPAAYATGSARPPAAPARVDLPQLLPLGGAPVGCGA
jgi:hypothetical protein